LTETSEEAFDKLVLTELKSIRKLLVTSLLLSGMDANLLANILGYKSKSSITNYFPVERIQDCDTERLDRLVAKLGGVKEPQEKVRKHKSGSK
jgi:hypothetical protein